MVSPASPGPLPPEVEGDAQHENRDQRDYRGRLVEEGGEHERQEDPAGGHDRDRMVAPAVANNAVTLISQ